MKAISKVKLLMVLLSIISSVNIFADVTDIASKQEEYSSGGAIAGGGGNGVVSSDGKVYLIDFIKPGYETGYLKNFDEIQNLFYSQNNKIQTNHLFVKGTSDFFRCGIDKIKIFIDEIPILNYVIEFLNDNQNLVYFSELRLIPIDKFPQKINKFLNYFVVRASKSYQYAVQEPIVGFRDGVLVISKRVYNRMDVENKCGVSTHETVRIINLLIPKLKLTDYEIEQLTRYFHNKSFANDNIKKIKNRIKQEFESSQYLMVHMTEDEKQEKWDIIDEDISRLKLQRQELIDSVNQLDDPISINEVYEQIEEITKEKNRRRRLQYDIYLSTFIGNNARFASLAYSIELDILSSILSSINNANFITIPLKN